MRKKIFYGLSDWEYFTLMVKGFTKHQTGERELIGLEHRTMDASIFGQKAEWIKEILYAAQYNIPEKLKKEILFELKYVTKQ